MKSKLIILSMLFAGACATANAQDTKENYYNQKWTDNIYIGAGFGGMAVFNDGMNTPTLNFNIKIGKQITPVWGTRLQFGGLWQSLDDQFAYVNDQKFVYNDYCKKFGEFNLDLTMSITNLVLGYNPDRALDFYAFAGPTMNLSSAVSRDINVKTGYDPNTNTNKDEASITYESDGMRARFGATVGLGLAYSLNNNWALNLEGRLGVTPSIFGEGSNCRKAEATGRLNIGFTYTFGDKANAGKYGRFAKVSDNVVVKEVTKEVIREVPTEVIKEVIKEIPSAASTAIFFKINKAVISPEGMVNIKLMAKTMKQNPNAKYKVAGFADKGTGSAAYNQTLSEKRAQAVYDALVAEGVSESQIEKVAMGGTDPMWEKAYLNRVVIMEVK